jgi:hypothetical protein
MSFDPNKRAEVFVATEAPAETAVKTKRHCSVVDRPSACVAEYAEQARQMVTGYFTVTEVELNLLRVPQWIAGLWSREPKNWRENRISPEGWRDNRTGECLTLDEARGLISVRIAELGLDRELVDACFEYRDGLAKYEQFRAMNFEQFLDMFRLRRVKEN